MLDLLDPGKYRYTLKGVKYAREVANGDIVVCKIAKGACQRFLDDIERAKDKSCLFYFDPDAAERFLRLGQKFRHVKGEWKTPHLMFEPWQCFIFMNVYGFISRETGKRRFRSVHVEVPRGNGKSAIASVVGLYHLSLDNPIGNEVYSAATGRDQARIILDSARAMAKGNKKFLAKTGTKVTAHQILHDKSNSFFRALSSDSNTLDGLQPACALIDELHSHKNRGVYDVIDSAMSKRDDSLLFVITTAGFSTAGIGYSQSRYAGKVALGEISDDSFFSIIYTIDEGDDIFDEKTWYKANPNMGVSVDITNFRSKAKKASENPEDKNNFLVKHLNIWTNAMVPFFNVLKFKRGISAGLRMEDFRGEACWTAIDLASKVDLTSFCYIFRPDHQYRFFWRNFVPEDAVNESKNAPSYIRWAEQGHLTLTQGEAINYPYLQELFFEDHQNYNFRGCHYDPWNASEFAQRMSIQGVDMIEFRMSTGNLSEAMKRLDALIREGNALHTGNELVEWCLGNVVAKRDANDNVFPRKDAEQLKIDPIVSAIMGLAGWMADEEKESVYEKRGLIVL